jgi:hypothetical protein
MESCAVAMARAFSGYETVSQQLQPVVIHKP